MNSYETLTSKQRKEVKENLLKQIKVIEKLEAEENSEKKSSSSIFKISLFSNKEDKEKVKAEKEKEKEKAKAEKEKEKEKAKAEKEKEKEKVKAEKEKAKAEKEKVKAKKEENDDDDKKPRAIKATITSMKEVLDYHHVDYPSNAKKDDLAKLLRENNLVREAEKKEANKKADK